MARVHMCMLALVLGVLAQEVLLASISLQPIDNVEDIPKDIGDRAEKQFQFLLGAAARNSTTSRNPFRAIMEGLRQGFRRVLSALQGQRDRLPPSVVNSTRVLGQLADRNRLDFSQLLPRLPLLSFLSPQRQFEEALKLIRPSEGTIHEDFFNATNGILDHITNPSFTQSVATNFISDFPSIMERMRNIMDNVLDVLGIGTLQ